MDCWKRLYSDIESKIWRHPWDVRVFCGYCVDSEIWQLTAPVRQNFFFLLFQKVYFHDWTILEKCTFSSSQWVSHYTFLFSWMICFSWMTLVTVLLSHGYFAWEPLKYYFASAICACCHQGAVENLEPVVDAVCFVDWTVRGTIHSVRIYWISVSTDILYWYTCAYQFSVYAYENNLVK